MPKPGTTLSVVAFVVVGLTAWERPAAAGLGCDKVLAVLASSTADVTCVESADLTTNNPATTPANNSIPGLPVGAFTPQTDRNVISPDPPNRTPIVKAVPGIQVNGRFRNDPTGQARFLLRFPDDWNGRLVVAGASGTRSEFNGDFAWSDFVLQKGYAYASQNKGVLNLSIVSIASPTPPEPDACRLNPSSQVWVHFFDVDPEKPFTQWTEYMIRATLLAQIAATVHYRHLPRRTYAVGTSNGGYQVRRALEVAPFLYDGGVDWEGTFIRARGPNLLIDLPPAIANWPAYVASGFDPNSLAAQNIRDAGYPPDLVSGTLSLWGLYWAQFWEVTQCQWQKRFDPTHVTYEDGPDDIEGTGGYDYFGRILQDPFIFLRLALVRTSGELRKPLITVAGTMDALLPPERHARAYEDAVADRGNRRQHRYYEVQNGNHIETFKNFFPQLELIQPHAQRAFDLLVEHVEDRAPLPPSQCVPRGGAISAAPADRGHCDALLVP